MYMLRVFVRSPLTGDHREDQWKIDPLTLDNAKMAKLKQQILDWCAALDAADASAPATPKDL